MVKNLLIGVSLSILHAECRVACLYENYDSGFYQKGVCACISYLDYEAAVKTKKKPIGPPKTEEKKEESSFEYSPTIRLKSYE